MRFGELFAGIGGIGLGLERAGMEVVWQVEKDDYCRRVLAKHWPDVTHYEDVKDVGAHNLEPVDLIAGGFPCQPVSQAGKKLAQEDERWLWPEFSRIIRELRPNYVLMENVPGLLVRGFGDVLGDLAGLGYDAEWGCVSAASVGAPHRRDRVFVVAEPQGERLEGRLTVRHKVAQERMRLLPAGQGEPGRENQWAVEPDVGRVAHGVPARVDRLRALGNAVVPQVAEYIGERIMKAIEE